MQPFWPGGSAGGLCLLQSQCLDWGEGEKRSLGEPWFLLNGLQVARPLGTGREAACLCLPAARSWSPWKAIVLGAFPRRGDLASPVLRLVHHLGLQQCFNLALLSCTWSKVPGERQRGQDNNSISWPGGTERQRATVPRSGSRRLETEL